MWHAHLQAYQTDARDNGDVFLSSQDDAGVLANGGVGDESHPGHHVHDGGRQESAEYKGGGNLNQQELF